MTANVELSPESLAAVEGGYRRILEVLAALPSCEFETTIPKEQEALWSAANGLRELLELAYTPSDLDLTKPNDEGTRKAFQAFMRWRCFTPHPLGDPGTVHIPEHTAEECQLEIYYQHGRWFATWLKLEEADSSAKECDLRELVCFEHHAQERRIVLVEVA